MRKLLLLLPIAALVAIAVGGAPIVTSIVPTSSSSDGVAPVQTPLDLPVLRHRDFGEIPVASPAAPATPAQPAQPSTAAVGTPRPADEDRCDSINNIDHRMECRERRREREERRKDHAKEREERAEQRAEENSGN